MSIEQQSTPLPEATGRMTRPEAYYEHRAKHYWILDGHGEWMTVGSDDLRRQLREAGFSGKIRDGETMSDLDSCINLIQRQFNVSYAGPLAGYQTGLHTVCGRRVLVSESYNLIKPVQGSCPTITGMLNEMFGPTQLPHVRGWIKVGYEALWAQQRRPGQVLVLAGERDSCKSLFQNLLTQILGGRCAKPYRYMSGATDFNGELFGAEHLMIEDEIASTDIRARRNFGSRIKDYTVNQVQSCHAKNRQAISLTPFWRVSVSVNDEPENLLILPPLEDSLEDKMVLLKVCRPDLPIRTQTLAERERFWNILMDELPAFLYELRTWEIPTEIRSDRFGVKHFHHPDILDALDQSSPETKLLRLLDESYQFCFADGNVPEDTAEAIMARLTCLQTTTEFEARKLLNWPNAIGTYLGRLAIKHPGRVSRRRTASGNLWKIHPPPPDPGRIKRAQVSIPVGVDPKDNPLGVHNRMAESKISPPPVKGMTSNRPFNKAPANAAPDEMPFPFELQ